MIVPFGDTVPILGLEVALKLAMALHGRRVYVAASPDATSPIALVIGLEAARALGAKLGGSTIKIPSSRARQELIRQLAKSGLSHADIAHRLFIDRETVRRCLLQRTEPMLDKSDAPDTQLSLFG